MTSRKSLPWWINGMATTLRTARAYAVQPVERDDAPVVPVPSGGEEERSDENPDRVTAGTGSRRRRRSADVHPRGTGEPIVIVDRGVAGFDHRTGVLGSCLSQVA